MTVTASHSKIYDIELPRQKQKQAITIYSPTIKTKRLKIGKSDFDRIAVDWRDYRDGKDMNLSEYRDRTRYSSYLFGLLKWLEDYQREHS